jgi:8-oxo-dGTP pyrophosphatase MutT (NUDIX family)
MGFNFRAAAEGFGFKHEETDTGGTKFPRRVDTTVHHPETGEQVGSARYFPPKRRGGPIHIDDVKTSHPGAGSALLNEIENRHPGSSMKFLHEVKRNNNNPDKTGHAHERAGAASDWDTHYPNLASTVHRGLSLRLPSHDAKTVNSSANSVDEHLSVLHSAIPQGPAIGTHWTENEHAARQFAHNGVADHRTDIPVVLHASTPERKDIETRHDHLYRGGVFAYGDEHSPENEVPVRKGRTVKVTGISWRPDASHPDADEHGWVHHTYPEPMHHTAVATEEDDDAGSLDRHDSDVVESTGPEEPEGATGGETPSSCSYCGSTDFEGLTDNGRVRQATCSACGGTMSAHDGAQWTPELIGDPSNHPKPDGDPRSGGVGGAAAVGMDPLVRDTSRLAHQHTLLHESHDPDENLTTPTKRVGFAGYVEGERTNFENHDNNPDWDDEQAVGSHTGVHEFRGYSGRENGFAPWHEKGEIGPVPLHGGNVYATQPRVTNRGVNMYLKDPDRKSSSGRPNYPANDRPIFVKHGGDYYTLDGHHRTAAAMLRGDEHVEGHVYDADKHGFPKPEWSPFHKSLSRSMEKYSGLAGAYLGCGFDTDDEADALQHELDHHDDGFCSAPKHRRTAKLTDPEMHEVMSRFGHDHRTGQQHAHREHTLTPVKHAGFKGYVEGYEGHHEDMKEADRDLGGHESGGGDFDEELHENTAPDPNTHERAHYEEHDDYPDSYFERHDEAYAKAKQEKEDAVKPVAHHGGVFNMLSNEQERNYPAWHTKGEVQHVDLSKHDVYAMQPHVVDKHVNRYLKNPGDTVAHVKEHGMDLAQDMYPGTHRPMFIKHENNLFTVEGHHRTASALLRKEPVEAHVYDADKHGFPHYDDDEDYGEGFDKHEGLQKHSMLMGADCDFDIDDPRDAHQHALRHHDDGVCTLTEAARHKDAQRNPKEAAVDGPDWCTWRRQAQCTFPNDRNNTLLAIPQVRGACPWTTRYAQQICPISEPGPQALMSAKGSARTAALSWDDIGDRHPHVYGDADIHGDAADGADGPGIGDAANYLAHERPGHQDAEDSSVHDLDFREETVHPRHIDYSPSGVNDPRVRSAREGYRQHPHEMPPLVLVKRHNVYQVADGHHRAEAAHGLDMPVRAYVADSPHNDKPFADGEKGPFHGAKPIPKERKPRSRMPKQEDPNQLKLFGSTDADTSYRMQHQAPDAEGGSPLHDVTANGTFPADVYTHPQYYDTGHADYYSTHGKIRAAQGQPDKKVRIYRALPAEHAHKGFAPGDWVSTSKEYARDHGRHHEDSKHDWPVISTTVPAKHLHTDGDLMEWGYNGEHKGGSVAFKGGHHQEVSQRADGSVRPVQRKAKSPERQTADELKGAGYSFSHYRPPAHEENGEHQIAAYGPDDNWAGMIKGHSGGSVHHVEIDPAHQHMPLEEHMRNMLKQGSAHTALSVPQAYELAKVARQDPEMAFHVTAAWSDVRSKAKRIRSEGKVMIKAATNEGLAGMVEGDHGTYENLITYRPGTRKIADWSCNCEWGDWAWKRIRFHGRQCSHSLALQYEAQSRGMFGKEVHLGALTFGGSETLDERAGINDRPISVIAHTMVQSEVDPGDIMKLLMAYGLSHSAALEMIKQGAWWDEENDDDETPDHQRDEHGNCRLYPDHEHEHYDEYGEGSKSCPYEGGHTDWDRVHPKLPSEIHRGMSVDLHRAGIHDLVHDSSRPVHERAHALEQHLGEDHIGTHWTDNGEQAKHYTHVNGSGPNAHHTKVVLHADKPHRHEIEEDPDELASGDVIGYGKHDDNEIPLPHGGDVRLKGISWHSGDQWHRHDFGEHKQHIASANMTEAEEDKRRKKHHRTLDTRRHAPNFGYGIPGWIGLPIGDCTQCGGWGCGHCGGTGQVAQDGNGNTANAVPDQNGDEGQMMSGGISDTSSLRTAKDSGPTCSGVALKAADTGRVLMLQRGLGEDHPAAGKWEFPGGHHEDGDTTSLHAGIREWEEEVGQQFPEGGTVHHTWTSPDGVYQGHVVVIPSEKDLSMKDGRVVPNPDDPKGDEHEQAAWWDIGHAKGNKVLRDEVRSGTPWNEIAKAGEQKTASTWDALSSEDDTPGFPYAAPLHSNSQNPGSTGFATSADPKSWTSQSEIPDHLLPESSYYGMRRTAEDLASSPTITRGMVVGDKGFSPDQAKRFAEGRASVQDVLHHVDTHEVGDFWHGHHNSLDDAKDFAETPDNHVGHEVGTEPYRNAHGEPVHFGEVGVVLEAHRPHGWDPNNNPDDGMMGNSYLPSPTELKLHKIHYNDHHDNWHSLDATGHTVRASGFNGHEATLHARPEPALPSTDGGDPDGYRPPETHGSIADVEESLSPNQITGSVTDIVAAFQATAGAKGIMASTPASTPGGGEVSFDFAAAARQYLAQDKGLQKSALKDFSFPEQQELINEGKRDDVRARNFSNLQIEGTHYEALGHALGLEDEDAEGLFS